MVRFYPASLYSFRYNQGYMIIITFAIRSSTRIASVLRGLSTAR